jgi:hypothetical protein
MTSDRTATNEVPNAQNPAQQRFPALDALSRNGGGMSLGIELPVDNDFARHGSRGSKPSTFGIGPEAPSGTSRTRRQIRFSALAA